MSQMQSADIESGVIDLLRTGLGQTIQVESLGINDINDDGQLIATPPCVRTKYVGCRYPMMHDNTATSYDAAPVLHIWCADEDLTSAEAQREASKRVLDLVKPVLAGARIPLSDDGTTTEPIILIEDGIFMQDFLGSVYVLTIQVPGIAQYPGTYAGVSGSED
jgi:hypothetical protein